MILLVIMKLKNQEDKERKNMTCEKYTNNIFNKLMEESIYNIIPED